MYVRLVTLRSKRPGRFGSAWLHVSPRGADHVFSQVQAWLPSVWPLRSPPAYQWDGLSCKLPAVLNYLNVGLAVTCEAVRQDILGIPCK